MKNQIVPRLIETKTIFHLVGFNSGERICQIQYIQTVKGIVAIDFWYNSNGVISRVAPPRELHKGEKVTGK